LLFWKFEYDGPAQLQDCISNNSLPPEKDFPGLENTYSYPFKKMKPGDGLVLAQLEGVSARIFAVGKVQAIQPHVVNWAAVNETVYPNPQGGLPNWQKKTSFEIKPKPARKYGLNGLIEKHINILAMEHYENDSDKALEGYLRDTNLLASARNAALARRRKALDEYACRACDFRLQVGKNWVVDVHHLNPLGVTGETVTTIDDLVCLCPTCHRIAHLRNPPYSITEIHDILRDSKGNA
jgi:predicted HNH restriction endonuclease